ncbi:MAG TPA: hypothetical protein VFH95_13630 [Candidatus Kapabacteria bacterium]|nr:hypothetical protein [Candidatus Kapabacteria bacterium]
MKTYRTTAIIGNEGKVELKLPFEKGEKVAIVVMPYDEALDRAEELDWMRLGLENFLKDDSPLDAAYDNY